MIGRIKEGDVMSRHPTLGWGKIQAE